MRFTSCRDQYTDAGGGHQGGCRTLDEMRSEHPTQLNNSGLVPNFPMSMSAEGPPRYCARLPDSTAIYSMHILQTGARSAVLPLYSPALIRPRWHVSVGGGISLCLGTLCLRYSMNAEKIICFVSMSSWYLARLQAVPRSGVSEIWESLCCEVLEHVCRHLPAAP